MANVTSFYVRNKLSARGDIFYGQKTSAPTRRPISSSSKLIRAGVGLGILGLAVFQPTEASALVIRTEPANALSLPTWFIHVSSVLEWVTAMSLIWKYADVSGNQKWKGMTWGMMPLLGGALCALTWHFFYNSPDLDFLVTIQASLTFLGNCTCGVAAYRIFRDDRSSQDV